MGHTHQHTGQTLKLRRIEQVKPVRSVLREVAVNDLVGEAIDDNVE